MLHLRPATIHDARFIWECRNDPLSRVQSISTGTIAYEDHLTWFRRMLASFGEQCWIAETSDQQTVGYGRLRHEGDCSSISVAVHPLLRSLGFGAELVRLTTQQVRRPVLATIRATNVASQRSFAAAGYRQLSTGDPQAWRWQP